MSRAEAARVFEVALRTIRRYLRGTLKEGMKPLGISGGELIERLLRKMRRRL
jgi:hypothetical protein